MITPRTSKCSMVNGAILDTAITHHWLMIISLLLNKYTNVQNTFCINENLFKHFLWELKVIPAGEPFLSYQCFAGLEKLHLKFSVRQVNPILLV